MALSGPTLAGAMILAGPEFIGPNGSRLFQAIGTAVHTWVVIPINVSLTGITTGQGGVGFVTGKLFMVPAVPAMAAALTAAGVTGLLAAGLARSVSMGLAAAFSASGTYTGPSIGVAIGVDTSKVIAANPMTLIPIMLASMASSLGGTGLSAPSVATGLSNGIAAQMLTVTGVGAVAGTPIPSPAPVAGTSPFGQIS